LISLELALSPVVGLARGVELSDAMAIDSPQGRDKVAKHSGERLRPCHHHHQRCCQRRSLASGPARRQGDLSVQHFKLFSIFSSAGSRRRRTFRRASSEVSGLVIPQSGQTNNAATLPFDSDKSTATISNGRLQWGHSSDISELLSDK